MNTEAQDQEQVQEARGHAGLEAGWLVFHVGLAAGTAGLAWHGLVGVSPALLWLLTGAIGADVLTGARSVWVAVREWRWLRHSPAYRALTRDLDETHQRAWQAYRAARRTEAEQDQAHGRRRGARS